MSNITRSSDRQIISPQKTYYTKEEMIKMSYKEEVMRKESAMASDRDIELVMSEMLDHYGNILLRMCFLYLKDVHLAVEIKRMIEEAAK